MRWKEPNSVPYLIFRSLTINRTASKTPLRLQQVNRLSKTCHSSNTFTFHSRRPFSSMPGPEANGFRGETHSHLKSMDEPKRIPNRLILCFDGTGNSFAGNTQDTNIVKLYDKFDRSAPNQMHYYQREWSSRRVCCMNARRINCEISSQQRESAPIPQMDPRSILDGLGNSNAQYPKP